MKALFFSVGDLVLSKGRETSQKEVAQKTGVKFVGPYNISKLERNN